jgi:hypothetical protein
LTCRTPATEPIGQPEAFEANEAVELFLADYTVSCGRLKAWTADGTNADLRAAQIWPIRK